ncbi:TIR domain-containing adapter molecule 1 [Cololabis saira]|uniref:TIR domain-containing adapter molecule 1 n=1 Tax=Cololabis saira TaxID=129043 RepID=UPI002AD38659|nr:TIR domain-containing adapter molecule 1 [Cololabis saira]
MSHADRENQGTGLGDVFDILLKTSSERLISLTFQLGESPEDIIIQALCLIILQKEALALGKLQMLKENPLASHLAEKWHSSGGKLEDFSVYCSQFQAQTGNSLIALARMFKILSEKRLCDQIQRNLAYKRALASDCLKSTHCDYLQCHRFREEAKVVCGPQFAEWMFSSTFLNSGSFPDANGNLDEGNTTLRVKVSQDESAGFQLLPNPLQDSPSEPSYPSHLEISFPPTASFQGDKAAPETDNLMPNVPESTAKTTPGEHQSLEHQPRSTGSPQSGEEKDSTMVETLATRDNMLKSYESPNEESPNPSQAPSTETKVSLPSSENIILPKMPSEREMHESKCAEEEEEEEEFYAFVILHAPEDVDVAESMKENFESIIGSTGATFTEDFAIPGKSTLRCVEDAVNNSAFTFLLLTHNFNTKMLEMKTNIALINSINKKHKFNTVIPLLPLKNCMPRQSVPIVLQTLVALDEKKSLEKKLQKALSPAKIATHKRIWMKEQKAKIQKQKEEDKMRLYMEQNLQIGARFQPDQGGGDGRPWWPQQSNIHIENANYIMIGNDSTMTVDRSGSVDKDD